MVVNIGSSYFHSASIFVRKLLASSILVKAETFKLLPVHKKPVMLKCVFCAEYERVAADLMKVGRCAVF